MRFFKNDFFRARSGGQGRSRGFTLAEMVIAAAIIAIVAVVALASYGRFNTSIRLNGLAYDVALAVRQAQVFGVSTRETTLGSGSFETGYGVHFEEGMTNRFLLFVDLDDDNEYDPALPPSTEEALEEFLLHESTTVHDLCVGEVASEDCTISELDIVFNRPDPVDIGRDAVITADNDPTHSVARVTLRSEDGRTRTVEIRVTGQISVQ